MKVYRASVREPGLATSGFYASDCGSDPTVPEFVLVTRGGFTITPPKDKRVLMSHPPTCGRDWTEFGRLDWRTRSSRCKALWPR
jgi:hypothetical protein